MDERKNIMILADTIEGEINRMCVTNELTELQTMHQHARKNIDKLLNMIYDYKFKKAVYCDTDSIYCIKEGNELEKV